MHLNELKARKKKLIFGKSAIHSWGLYAAEPIEKEDFVVEYLGEYVRAAVADAREKHYRRAGFGDDYIFRVDAAFLVDATIGLPPIQSETPLSLWLDQNGQLQSSMPLDRVEWLDIVGRRIDGPVGHGPWLVYATSVDGQIARVLLR